MKIIKECDLTQFNSYRIRSKCKIAYFPENEEDVKDFYENNEFFFLLGSGNNVILTKDYYDEVFLIFNGNFNGIEVNRKTGMIEAEAGISMLEVSELALISNLRGLEIFYDIPSSLGGAVVMNAGASGEEIKDVLVKVRYFDPVDMDFKEISKKELDFEYRNSFFQRNTDKVILKAWLKLEKGNREAIRYKMETTKAARWAKQPREYPNAGSVFKRPKGFYVGAIMDDLSLKGYRIGGAKISEKHGGFIINFENAKGKDVLGIIENVKQKAKEKFNVELETEQRIF